MAKSFSERGTNRALETLGLSKQADTSISNTLRNAIGLPEEKSTFQKVLPWAAGALAAPLAYKYLRTPSLSQNPALRAIQERAQKGFHRVVDVSRTHTTDGNWHERLREWWKPQVNREGNLNLVNRIKLWLQEGGEAIPVASANGRTWLPNQKPGAARTVKGVVQSRHVDLADAEQSASKLIRGGVDLEGSKATQRAMTELGEAGKGFEANLLQQYAPDAIPETVTDIQHFIQGLATKTPQQRLRAVRQLQQRMRTSHGKHFMLKPNLGLQSGGAFPWGKDKWHKQLEAYEKHIANPETLKAYRAAEARGPGDLAAYMEEHGIDEGRILYHALTDPKSVLLQQAVKNPLGEYRIHLMQGEAPTSLMTPRYGGSDLAKLHLGLSAVSKDELKRFSEDVIRRLPEKYRTGSYGMDVMPFRKPDGTVGFKVIELNPSERAYHNATTGAHNMGGGSGFLDTDVMPYAGLAQYRAVTGRHATPVALGGALGAGGVAAGTAAATTANDG